MKKTISVIGSTGSVGTQALEVIAARGHRVAALAAGKNAEKLLEQARRFSPRIVAVFDGQCADFLKKELAGMGIEVLSGIGGICAAASAADADIVLNAAVGIAGLRPTLSALDAGKTLALANKESLVCAGDIVMERARMTGAQIIPVDSEHSAVFQCMLSSAHSEIERIILTASGGPLFGMTGRQMERVTPAKALAHPNWSMGKKITIDSATLMNKGFEMLEAMHLFDLKPTQIEAVIHRESIIHSLVGFCDGSVLAQLSPPDMGLAVQYAIDYPYRFTSKRERMDLVKLKSFTFYEPDEDAFPSLSLCRNVMEKGGNLGAALNGANEAAVELFLQGEIGFNDIYRIAKSAVDCAEYMEKPAIEDIFKTDAWARAHALNLAQQMKKEHAK